MAKKSITVKLYVKELVYDVQNKTHLTGRSRFNGNNDEEVANMKNNDDTEDTYQVIRSIATAFNYLKTKLSEYIDETSSETTMTANNLIAEYEANADTTAIEILLNHLPSNFNMAMKTSLSMSIHDYIVRRAIGEWFMITDKADAADYITQSQNSLAEIREAINKRVRPSRPNIPSGVGGGSAL